MILSISKELFEEETTLGACKLQLQCSWKFWENYVKDDLLWKSILAMSPSLFCFCLVATYVLSSRSNLLRWHLSGESSCFLCQKEHCTLAHVLGSCNIYLQQGRFKYRNDSVLLKLIDSLKVFINGILNKVTQNKKICFVKSGTAPPKRVTNKSGILFLANDWKVVTDCNKQHVFSIQIAINAICQTF